MALVDPRLSCDVKSGWTTTRDIFTSLSTYLNIKRDPITITTPLCGLHNLKRTHLYPRGTSPAQPAFSIHVPLPTLRMNQSASSGHVLPVASFHAPVPNFEDVHVQAEAQFLLRYQLLRSQISVYHDTHPDRGCVLIAWLCPLPLKFKNYHILSSTSVADAD